ncbi:hypothetical protein ACHAQJ_006384 [Trichoderma viride]
MPPRLGSGSGSGSGSGHGLGSNQAPDMERQRCTNSAASMPASAVAVSLSATLASTSASSASASAPAPALTPLQRLHLPRPPPFSSASLFSASSGSGSGSGSISAPASSASAAIPPPTNTQRRRPAHLPSIAATTATAATAIASSPASPPPPPSPSFSSPSSVSSSASSSSSWTVSHPILPPLPFHLPRQSSPSYLPWTSLHHFPVFDPLVSVSAPLHSSINNADANANADNSDDNPSHFSTPSFNHFPNSQPMHFWPAYESSIDVPATTWDESAHGFSLLDAARAINQAVTDLSFAAATPITTQPPIAQSPTQPQHHSRLDFDYPSNFYDCPHAPTSTSASASAPSPFAAAPTSTSTAPTSAGAAPTPSRQRRQRHHSRATRYITSWAAATHNPASPPASDSISAFALPRTSAGASFGRGIGAFNGIFDEIDDDPNFPFPFPLAETPDTSFSSTSDTMPTTSTARRRTRSQVMAPEVHGDSTPVAHASKRQRVMPSATEPTSTSLQPAVDDDNDSLFGFSPSRPGSSSGLKDEDYTTIDLTEATDVPDELKKPEVDNRVKVSAFQCVICMDDVTGLTLTHCGHLFCAQCLHSSLNIESTRGKCPMCRAKIDMKTRDNYSMKTKGYWPLELKLMTTTRQGKRKAQAMA